MPSWPVGLSRDLPPARVMRAQVDGRDLVVWRTMAGQIAAWDNRCPHRGMALSHGFVRGEQLACLYHGWHYDGAGRCGYIPAHPDLAPPDTIRAEVFSVIEAQGVIWVSVDGTAEAPAVDSGLKPLRSLDIAADEAQIRVVAELDPSDTALLITPIGLGLCRVIALCPDPSPAAARWCEALRRRAESAESQAA